MSERTTRRIAAAIVAAGAGPATEAGSPTANPQPADPYGPERLPAGQ